MEEINESNLLHIMVKGEDFKNFEEHYNRYSNVLDEILRYTRGDLVFYGWCRKNITCSQTLCN
jgi:hypothetical protein